MKEEMKEDMRKGIFAVSIMMVLAVFLAVGPVTASADEALKPLTMTWIAGGVGGGWYVQAGGIARMISEKEPKLVVKVIPGGGMVNPVRVSGGKDDLGWGITFVDKMAFNGTAPLFDKPNPNVRALGGIFGTYHVHFVAAQDKGIKTVAELANMVKAGKAIRVALPMKGTSDLPLVENILAFYGISIEAIKKAGGTVHQATYADMASLYQDRHVDFVLTHLALPAAAVTEMFFSRACTILAVSNECIDKLAKDLGTLSRDSGLQNIPKGTYKGQADDIPTVVSTGELLINKDVPDQVAYTLTKILCKNISELHKINIANQTFIPEKGWVHVAVPLHPGAVKFYKEAGYMK